MRSELESLTSSQKGEIAKLKVEQRSVEKGWISSRTIESARYDLVLDNAEQLFRVQVKYAAAAPGHTTTGAVVANLRRQQGDDRNLRYRRSSSRSYTEEEVDAILIYIPQVDAVCWFGPEHFVDKPAISIRYVLPKNGQMGKVKMVEDFRW